MIRYDQMSDLQDVLSTRPNGPGARRKRFRTACGASPRRQINRGRCIEKSESAGCRKLKDKVLDAIAADGRIPAQDLDFKCLRGRLTISGALADGMQRHLLQKIVLRSSSGVHDTFFDIFLHNFASEDHEDTAPPASDHAGRALL